SGPPIPAPRRTSPAVSGKQRRAPRLIRSTPVSSEPAPPVATKPGDSGAEFMAALLARLNGGDDPRLAAFGRSFARRVRLEHHDDADIDRLAALIVGLFRLVDDRRGELGVRALNPSHERDGYATDGTIIQANTDDAPFLIDTVNEELRRHGLDVRLVLHPVMGIERDAS